MSQWFLYGALQRISNNMINNVDTSCDEVSPGQLAVRLPHWLPIRWPPIVTNCDATFNKRCAGIAPLFMLSQSCHSLHPPFRYYHEIWNRFMSLHLRICCGIAICRVWMIRFVFSSHLLRELLSRTTPKETGRFRKLLWPFKEKENSELLSKVARFKGNLSIYLDITQG